MKVLIISGHDATIKYLSEIFGNFEVRVIQHLSDLNEVNEDIVVGNLPLPLIAELLKRGKRFIYVSLIIPAELRGKELNSEQVKEYIELYEIKNLELERW